MLAISLLYSLNNSFSRHPALASPCEIAPLELLVFEFALQLLRLGYLPHCLVEVVLVDCVAVVLDCKQTTRETISSNVLPRDSGIW